MSKFFKALQQAEQERALRSGSMAELPGPRAVRGSPADAASEAPAERAVPRTAQGVEGVEEHLISLLRPSSFEAEQYRALAHVVERLHETNAVKVVGIASPSARDGKTVTAINLAGALAQQAQSKVLLLEADLRQPIVARYLGLSAPGLGLTQLIADPGLTLAHAATRVPGVHFDVLTAGHQSAIPYELLRSRRAEEIVQEARRTYDYVVVDTPPLVAVPETPVIEKLVDGLLVVVRAHRTPRQLLEEALRLTSPEKVFGLVFNGDDRLAPGFDRYYRYWDREPLRNGHGNH